MREYVVRLVVRTNEDPDKELYYDDQEMPRVIRDWFDGALDDRDDGPHIVWSEFRLRPTAQNHEHVFADGRPTCVRYAECEAVRPEAGS